MSTSAFIGKSTVPTHEELTAALGEAKPVWDQLLAELDRELGANLHEWKTHRDLPAIKALAAIKIAN